MHNNITCYCSFHKQHLYLQNWFPNKRGLHSVYEKPSVVPHTEAFNSRFQFPFKYLIWGAGQYWSFGTIQKLFGLFPSLLAHCDFWKTSKQSHEADIIIPFINKEMRPWDVKGFPQGHMAKERSEFKPRSISIPCIDLPLFIHPILKKY